METKTYEGSCHCGAVKFDVAMAKPEKVFTCNCSICSRAGWLLAFVPAKDFTLKQGKDALGEYQFHKREIHHTFCKTCGIHSFSHGKDKQGQDTYSINTRCIPALEATKLPVQEFDGASM